MALVPGPCGKVWPRVRDCHRLHWNSGPESSRLETNERFAVGRCPLSEYEELRPVQWRLGPFNNLGHGICSAVHISSAKEKDDENLARGNKLG